MSATEFSVYQIFVDGSREDVLKFVGEEQAARTAVGLATSVGARLGTTERVFITDGGDQIVWEWTHADGVVWPEELKGQIKPAS